MANTDNTKSKYYNPFVTTGGTYENPRLGIVDYTQIQTGWDEGMKPGLELVEQREKDYLARIKTADGLEEITTAAGDFFEGNNFNPDISMVNAYKDAVNDYRDVLLKRNSSIEDIKSAKEAVGHLRASNESLAYLLDVDSDSELYSERASRGIGDLFIKQGLDGGLEEFKNAYNEGKLKPATRMIGGNQVGGFTMMKNGKEIFLNFETGINQTTIDGKMNLRTDNIIQEASNEMAKGDYGHGPGIGLWDSDKMKAIVNDPTLGKSQMETEIKTLKEEYKRNVSMQAASKSREWLLNNPQYMAHTLVQMKDGLTLSEADRFHLNQIFVGDYGSNREYNINAINDGYEYNGTAQRDPIIDAETGLPKVDANGNIEYGETYYVDMFGDKIPQVEGKEPVTTARMKGAKELAKDKKLKDPNYTITDAQKEIKNMFDDFRFNMATKHVANEYMKNVPGAAIGDDGMVGFQKPQVDTKRTISPFEPPSGWKGGGGGTDVDVDVSALKEGASKMYTLKGLVDAAWDGDFANIDDNFSKLIDTPLTNNAMITRVERDGNMLTIYSKGKSEKAKEKEYKTVDLGNEGDRLELYTSLGITPYLEKFNESPKDYMGKEFTFRDRLNEKAFDALQNIKVEPAKNRTPHSKQYNIGVSGLKLALGRDFEAGNFTWDDNIMKILEDNGYDIVPEYNPANISPFTGDSKTLNLFNITKDGENMFEESIDIRDGDYHEYLSDILKKIDFESQGKTKENNQDVSFSSNPTS